MLIARWKPLIQVYIIYITSSATIDSVIKTYKYSLATTKG